MSEDDEVKHYGAADGKLRVTLTMFGPAMFSDRFALFFLVVSVLTKVFIYAGIATIIVPAMFEALE
jgi:hypothetical protein